MTSTPSPYYARTNLTWTLTPEAAELDGEGPTAATVLYEAMALVTQTCDVVRSCSVDGANRPLVQVSPVVRLHGPARREAETGRSPRYADDAFADLDRCTTIEKTFIAGSDRVRGCPTNQSLIDFGRAVARLSVAM